MQKAGRIQKNASPFCVYAPSILGLYVNDVRLQVIFQSMLAVRPTDTRLTPAGMEALHRLEVLPVDIGLAKL